MASAFLFRGKEEEGGLPSGSHVLMVSLPRSHTVFNDTIETEELPLALDPGKYAYCVSKMRESNAPTGSLATEIQYNGEFYHDCKPEDFDVLQRLSPQAARFRNTSNGGRWFCQMGWGCRVSTGTEIAMVLHECEGHLGITKDDLLKDKRASISYKMKAVETMNKRKAEEARKSGQPTKA
jgi:hypothetical protein